MRALVAEARALRQAGGRTVVFIDELHRFNKSQQDALLPHVEDGTIVLIGATTENPYYEINSPLLSRMRVYRLQALDEPALRSIVSRALTDRHGLAGAISLTDAGLAALLDLSGGDARQALNILESAASVTDALDADEISEAAQQRLLAYDRVGDQHYEAASAFIKSMRGNDPDAALYWCASMIAAGEDPTFVARRIVIAASEDVGNADPRALQVAVAAMQAVEMIGLPEAQYALAQAAAYVASAPKSNRAGAAYFAASPRSRRRVGCRCRSICGRRPIAGWRGSMATARATSIRTTSRAPMSSSSTCPTSSTARSTTSRPRRAWSRRSGSGSSGCDALGGTPGGKTSLRRSPPRGRRRRRRPAGPP